ncbi:MAG: FecR domain-containing protein [Spirochaetales bacterium]|nr:FecR domain-containing protein [Spirochaetales bacterium]
MKKAILSAFLLSALCFPVFSAESDVVYIDGWVDLKDSSGEVYELFIGDRVFTGDTVITGDDGVAELEPESGSRIIIKPGTVFSIKEQNINGKKHSVVSTTLGEVAFKFNKMTQEPIIATPSTIMGIRGTEFTVYAGADGSSLVVVDSGAVEVSSQGESVYLEAQQGVEVLPGKTPGEKFPVMGKAVDFAEWNVDRIDKMMASPGEALASIASQMDSMAAQTAEWTALHTESTAELVKLRADMDALFDAGKDDEARELYAGIIRPLEITSLRYVMNYRYYALSALSMRQHILSGFYIRMKTAFIGDKENPVYKAFTKDYRKILTGYEQRIVPNLVEADY